MEFPKISKEEWKAKIEAELKGRKTLDELKYQIGKELDIDVLLQEEDRFKLEELSSFPDIPSYGIYFEGNPSNQIILESLVRGASSLYLEGETILGWDQLLDGVNMSYITFIVNDISQAENSEVSSKLSRKDTIELQEERIIDLDRQLKEETLIESLKEVIQSNGNIGLRMNDAVIMNVSLMRAIRSISEKRGRKDKLIAFIGSGEEALEYQLIRYTTQAIAAISGGCDHILFPIHEDCTEKDASKIIHISNVLTHESRMTRFNDPWKGAYVIEKITKEFIEKIEKGGP
ncbi:MAG: hypothetical protein HKN68_19840 [Saprospiraceae bacterium]|nr:hypothetical protein [Saprospiraceae bacterium]